MPLHLHYHYEFLTVRHIECTWYILVIHTGNLAVHTISHGSHCNMVLTWFTLLLLMRAFYLSSVLQVKVSSADVIHKHGLARSWLITGGMGYDLSCGFHYNNPLFLLFATCAPTHWVYGNVCITKWCTYEFIICLNSCHHLCIQVVLSHLVLLVS